MDENLKTAIKEVKKAAEVVKAREDRPKPVKPVEDQRVRGRESPSPQVLFYIAQVVGLLEEILSTKAYEGRKQKAAGQEYIKHLKAELGLK